MNIKKKSIINHVLISLLSLLLFIPCMGYSTIKADEEVETNDIEQVVEVEETQEEVVLEQETIVEQEQLEIEEVELPTEVEENSVVLEPVEDVNELASTRTTTMKPNDKKTFTISSLDQTEIIKITLPKSGYFTFNLKFLKSKSCISWYFTDQNDKRYYYGTSWNEEDDRFKESQYFSGGTYKIVLEPYDYSSDFVGRKVEITTTYKATDTDAIKETITTNNDTLAKAFKVDFNKSYSGTITRNEEYDYYKFTVTDKYINPYLYISCKNMRFDAVHLLDSSGKTIEYYITTDDFDDNLDVELKKGTYYLLFDKFGDSSTGQYTFKLSKKYNGWMQDVYWYENGVRQGVYGDKKNVWYDGIERGREIYDADSDGWYWLDANAEGKKATNKEVFMPYIYQDEKKWTDSQKRQISYESNSVPWAKENALLADQVYRAMTGPVEVQGKWVRYDSDGKMYKGWTELYYWPEKPWQEGNVYYYDEKTGLMAKGPTIIDNKTYYFDENTGVCSNPPR